MLLWFGIGLDIGLGIGLGIDLGIGLGMSFVEVHLSKDVTAVVV